MRIGQTRGMVIKTNPENSRLGMGGASSYNKTGQSRYQGMYEKALPQREERRDYESMNHRNLYAGQPGRKMTDRSLPENIERAMLVDAPERGAIYLVDFGDDKSCCLTVGARPAVCISADSYHGNSPILRVVPMTKHFKSIDAGYHVFINRDKCIGLKESGMALGEQTRPIDRSMIIKKIGGIADEGLFEEILTAADAIVKSYK